MRAPLDSAIRSGSGTPAEALCEDKGRARESSPGNAAPDDLLTETPDSKGSPPDSFLIVLLRALGALHV
jgi:hypothetical protein